MGVDYSLLVLFGGEDDADWRCALGRLGGWVLCVKAEALLPHSIGWIEDYGY